MDCKEFQEYISALVDNQIDDIKRKEAEEHLSRCALCFFDYKIENLVKKIVSFKFHKSPCPEVLKNQIIFSLVSKRSFSEQLLGYIKLLLANKYLKTSLAIGVLLIAAILLIKPSENGNEKYYSELATVIYQNCKELKNHNYPEKTIFTTNPVIVQNFISANGISNPKMPKTDWVVLAAGIENYDEYYAAHLLFKCEEDTVYMMECDVDKLYKSGYLHFFKEIHNDLEKQKFVKIDYNDFSIVFRLEDNVLMAFSINSNNQHAFEELIASLD